MASPALEAPGVTVDRPSLRQQGITAAGSVGMVVAAAALVVAVAFPKLPGVSSYDVQVGVLVFFFAMLGTSWTVAAGYGGMHSIGHTAFVGIGAYTSTLLYVDFKVSPWLGMPAGMVLAAVLAVIIGWPCFKFGIRGDYFALVTVALGQVCYEFATGASSLTKGSAGIPFPLATNPWSAFQFDSRSTYYYIAMGMWAVVVVVAYRLRRSVFGSQLLAVRDDEAAAERGGIDVRRSKLIALAVSAAMAAAAGTFYAQFILFIDPGSVFSLTLSVQIVLMAVLGGMNSFLGGTVGALILVPLSQVLSTELSNYNGLDLTIYGVILVALVLVMPMGILGLFRKSPRWRKAFGW